MGEQQIEGGYHSPDVLVIGGGPAGTTAGTLLARQGFSVTLLEKDEHPRFHIGESLLPMNMPILERLGVIDDVSQLGLRKLGADFTVSERAEDFNTVRFENALGGSPGYAFEVKRDEFDHLLFKNCQKAGVETRERTRVVHVELDEESGSHRVKSLDVDGNECLYVPKLVIDASGRNAFLSSKQQWKKKSDVHASAAIFGHFSGVEFRNGDDAGNISIYWFEHGWIWLIPLKNGTASVGAVCWPEYLKTRSTDSEAFLKETLNLCQPLMTRMENASLVSPVWIEGNFSYKSQRLFGPGYLLVGDAYAFVDPVFSSGVYLAMDGAERAIPAARAWLLGSRSEYMRAGRVYEQRTEKGLKVFSWFIHRFTSPAMRNLFASPRNQFDVGRAVTGMLAGDVYENKAVLRRLWLFKVIYGFSWLLSLRGSFLAWRLRRANAKADFDIPTYADSSVND